ncbi:hypothetical protein CTA2_5648 [Colletotrichum tanaceti]|uniref:Uncharacterized protein n=1 Tax=Colletotrichum tanaceti TaxID=1306861 RepID=A0A4U6XCT5_9PEZI|nr:hypothetical protein CTA2_5648 [Colletotrichum tanaceti]TKW53224.1 hypothetical protein CTA1_8894 [Colletotrichum tanaceti]
MGFRPPPPRSRTTTTIWIRSIPQHPALLGLVQAAPWAFTIGPSPASFPLLHESSRAVPSFPLDLPLSITISLSISRSFGPGHRAYDSIDYPESTAYFLQMDELFLLTMLKRSVLDAGCSCRFPHTC